MSDYMFMLESHLSPDQNRVVAEVQAAASAANVNLFLTGGAMRDMLGGFQIRDLDFTVEGNAVKLGKGLAVKSRAQIASLDEYRGSVELLFEGNVTAEIRMARKERFTKPGVRPFVTPGTIQEDLRRRDFTINAIALSLNRASKGLLLDPMNGLAEIGRRELRALSSTAFFDDPSRLLRLVRFRIRLGYAVEERTLTQFENAREANVQQHISRRALCEELKHIAGEPNASELVRALEQGGLLALYSPAFAGAKLNYAGLTKLE
ncbi:MAG: CCA tRNA nucleotidyltransferase, partial [Bryobacteraceae bacterium]